MNVIDYITITCNLKNGRLQITSNYDYPMSAGVWGLFRSAVGYRDRAPVGGPGGQSPPAEIEF